MLRLSSETSSKYVTRAQGQLGMTTAYTRTVFTPFAKHIFTCSCDGAQQRLWEKLESSIFPLKWRKAVWQWKPLLLLEWNTQPGMPDTVISCPDLSGACVCSTELWGQTVLCGGSPRVSLSTTRHGDMDGSRGFYTAHFKTQICWGSSINLVTEMCMVLFGRREGGRNSKEGQQLGEYLVAGARKKGTPKLSTLETWAVGVESNQYFHSKPLNHFMSNNHMWLLQFVLQTAWQHTSEPEMGYL